jgi:hypothetical protein
MTSDDRPKLPRATVRDEKLYVEGEKEPYFQDLREGTIYLRVDALSLRRLRHRQQGFQRILTRQGQA